MTIQESLDRLVNVLQSADKQTFQDSFSAIAEALEIDAEKIDTEDTEAMISAIKEAVSNVEENDVEAVVEEISQFFTEEEDEEDDEELDEEPKTIDDAMTLINEGMVSNIATKALKGLLKKQYSNLDLNDPAQVYAALQKSTKHDTETIMKATMKVTGKSSEEVTNSLISKLGEEKTKKDSFFISASDLDLGEDTEAMFNGEELSEQFQEKAKTIFENAVVNKVNEKVAQIIEEYEDVIEEKKQEIEKTYAEKLDEYLDYVISEWTEENKIALESGIRTEMNESLIGALKTVLEEHYVDLPEDKVDMVEELQSKVAELEQGLNEALDQNSKLHKELRESRKEDINDSLVEGLSDMQREKLLELLESVEVNEDDNTLEEYEKKAKTIRENYFPTDKQELNEDNRSDDVDPVEIEENKNSSINRYAQALNRFSK